MKQLIRNHRHGSALLIVLGMLSFMLFSGIAFSAYMRQSRMPSSFLRRTTSVRQLAKAALAEAVVDIEQAMGNRLYRSSEFWQHRVLVSSTNAAFTSEETVPTLMLESLAYVPPPLINELRYYSRQATTARWHGFSFDAGRFAYTIVDVSDYFDVNRILANRSRSAAASRRVSFAYLFEKSREGKMHGAPIAGAAKEWDDWMENDAKARKVDPSSGAISFGGRMPFVSIADFNLALGSRKIGLLRSPFVAYLDDPYGEGFYPGVNDGSFSDEQAGAYRSMAFVTDSYQPKEMVLDDEGKPAKMRDLGNEANQPFESVFLNDESHKERGFDKVMSYSRRATMWNDCYCNLLSRLGMCALCDYLDVDSVPTSLSIPTCERNPMIAAVSPLVMNAALHFTSKKGEVRSGDGNGKPVEDSKATTRQVSRTDVYYLNGNMLAGQAARIWALGAFPFRREDPEELPSWKVDGKLMLFFTLADRDIPLIVDDGMEYLKTSGAKAAATVISKDDWRDKNLRFDASRGIIMIPFGGGGAFGDFHKTIETEAEAVASVDMAVNNLTELGKLFKTGDEGSYFMRVTRKWEQQRAKTNKGDFSDWEPADPPENAEISKFESRMPLIGADGKTIAPKDLPGRLKEYALPLKLKLNAAIALRVKDEDDNTVDLVPAALPDDVDQGIAGSFRNYQLQFNTAVRGYDSTGSHLLKLPLAFGGDGAVSAPVVSINDIDQACAVKGNDGFKRELDFGRKQILMVEDPRYNHNPESWYVVKDEVDSLEKLKAGWLARHHAGDAGRDGDIFLTTSDQGYLQSVYELAYIPRGSVKTVIDTRPEMEGGVPRAGANVFYGDLSRPTFTRTELLEESARAQALNAELMWKSYRPFGNDPDDFEDLRITSGFGGYRVNPYTESPDILMAAFANTPHSWRVCSTNEVMNPDSNADDVETFNLKHAWNAYCEDEKSRIEWEDLMKIAENFMTAAREKADRGGSWEEAFEQLGWTSSDPTMLAGVKLSNDTKISSVDRKFFYGFWRDCFNANQQLFLVFLRAEPMMMGGGVASTVPPQLGTRAVAVIWRDPRPTPVKDGYPLPHRTRVLFYHPID